MRTVGEMLQEARLAKGYSLDKVEQATKIRAKFLAAIEADEYARLPSLAYAKGFVKNYSEYLGLNSKTILAFFRRQTLEVPKSSLLPRGVADPLNKPFFRITPSRFLAFLLLGLVSVFLLYFGLQYRQLRLEPRLTIDAPKDQTITSERRIDVLGVTDADATVTINGISVLVRSDGKFFDQVSLVEGINRIVVASTSRFGKVTTQTREVTLQL